MKRRNNNKKLPTYINDYGTWEIVTESGKLVEKCRTYDYAKYRKAYLERNYFGWELKIIKNDNYVVTY